GFAAVWAIAFVAHSKVTSANAGAMSRRSMIPPGMFVTCNGIRRRMRYGVKRASSSARLPVESRGISRPLAISDNHAMDADEFARIGAALVAAIAEAKVVVRRFGVSARFREIVRHAREMHELPVEAMIANEHLQTEYLSGLSVTAENA